MNKNTRPNQIKQLLNSLLNLGRVTSDGFQLIAINFSRKSPHFSLLSPTSPCELSEREVTSPSNLKVFVTQIFIGRSTMNVSIYSENRRGIYFSLLKR